MGVVGLLALLGLLCLAVALDGLGKGRVGGGHGVLAGEVVFPHPVELVDGYTLAHQVAYDYLLARSFADFAAEVGSHLLVGHLALGPCAARAYEQDGGGNEK